MSNVILNNSWTLNWLTLALYKFMSNVILNNSWTQDGYKQGYDDVYE